MSWGEDYALYDDAHIREHATAYVATSQVLTRC